jgi:hypothetical protein
MVYAAVRLILHLQHPFDLKPHDIQNPAVGVFRVFIGEKQLRGRLGGGDGVAAVIARVVPAA